MERLIATDMLFYLRNNNLITKHQHGLLSRHSACTQLIETINDCSVAFENKFSVDSAYLDFGKTFDTVSHHKLIFKLESYGISGNLLAWIKAFLTNRLQRVQVGNCLSSLINVISCVPQGSVLGPHCLSFRSMMFLIFYGFLCNCKTLCRRCKIIFLYTVCRWYVFLTARFRFRPQLVSSLAAISVCY